MQLFPMMLKHCNATTEESEILVFHKLLHGRYDIIVSKMVTTQVEFEEITWS